MCDLLFSPPFTCKEQEAKEEEKEDKEENKSEPEKAEYVWFLLRSLFPVLSSGRRMEPSALPEDRLCTRTWVLGHRCGCRPPGCQPVPLFVPKQRSPRFRDALTEDRGLRSSLTAHVILCLGGVLSLKASPGPHT